MVETVLSDGRDSGIAGDLDGQNATMAESCQRYSSTMVGQTGFMCCSSTLSCRLFSSCPRSFPSSNSAEHF